MSLSGLFCFWAVNEWWNHSTGRGGCNINRILKQAKWMVSGGCWRQPPAVLRQLLCDPETLWPREISISRLVKVSEFCLRSHPAADGASSATVLHSYTGCRQSMWPAIIGRAHKFTQVRLSRHEQRCKPGVTKKKNSWKITTKSHLHLCFKLH